MIMGPAHWLKKLMELTRISWDFKLLILALGAAYGVIAWVGEHYVFQRLARFIGSIRQALTQRSKKRKEYKVILERMRM